MKNAVHLDMNSIFFKYGKVGYYLKCSIQNMGCLYFDSVVN